MWVNVSSTNPCPVCGSTKWCATDGHKVCCRKQHINPKIDANGSAYSIYNVDDELPSSPPISRNQVNVENCSIVYPLLLQKCPLSKEHRQHLMGRGLSKEWIDRAGYGSLYNHRDQIVSSIDADLTGVPGFVHNGEWKLVGPSGLLIPVRDYDGRVVAVKVRPDNPIAGKYVWLSSRRYNGLSPGNQPHFPHLSIPRIVRITEGELKADVATCLGSIYTISIPGITCFKPLLPLLPQLSLEGIVITPDSDFRTNPNVKRALRLLIDALSNYRVVVQTWPPEWGKGIDDVLQQHRDRETVANKIV